MICAAVVLLVHGMTPERLRGADCLCTIAAAELSFFLSQLGDTHTAH